MCSKHIADEERSQSTCATVSTACKGQMSMAMKDAHRHSQCQCRAAHSEPTFSGLAFSTWIASCCCAKSCLLVSRSSMCSTRSLSCTLVVPIRIGLRRVHQPGVIDVIVHQLIVHDYQSIDCALIKIGPQQVRQRLQVWLNSVLTQHG
jgi:hypothetical protein